MDVNKPIPSNYGYFAEKYGAIWESFIESLKAEFGDSLEMVLKPSEAKTDMPVIFIKKSAAFSVIQSIKDRYGFEFLTDYTATDEIEEAGAEARFHLVLHLMQIESKARIRIKIKIAENEKFQSLIPLWAGANWAEREIFDMFGIQFSGHPDLRRILMDMRWEGHPLRKDYPLRGYQIFLTPEPLDTELLK